MKRFALAVLFVLLVAGCGGGDDESSGGSDSPATTATTATTATRCEPQSGASISKKLSPMVQERPTMYLTNVEVEGEDCVERVIFKFESSEGGPGYDVSYQPANVAKTQDGSGTVLQIAGDDFLVVRMFPAMTAKIEGEDVEPTYDGPRNITPPADAKLIREVAMTGDFEAQVTWAIGLAGKRPFTVTASDDELVVEITKLASSS